MTFLQNHEPQSFNELIFHDTAVEQVLREYADGHRTKHLILHGPKGSGKSCAAQMILKSRLPHNFPDATTLPINGRTDRNRKDWEIIWSNWNAQISNGCRGYTHLDEIDRYNLKQLDMLDEFLEHDRLGTLVMTTNHLENLDEWFTDRCTLVEVLRPTGSDMVGRAHAILQAEGYSYDRQEVGSMLSGFQGSLRKMVEALENYVLKHPPETTPASNGVQPNVTESVAAARTQQPARTQQLTVGGKTV